MRKTVVFAICWAALAAMNLSGVAAATSPDAFRGTWTSIDIDGSHQTMKIRGAGQPGRDAVVVFDDAATGACQGAPARVRGPGEVDGNRLVVTGRLACLGGGGFGVIIEFRYDPVMDTLTDVAGVTWFRASGATGRLDPDRA